MKNLCFLPLVHFLCSCHMNGKNLCQSLVSKEHLLDFALPANSGNGPLSKFNNHTISVSAKV